MQAARKAQRKTEQPRLRVVFADDQRMINEVEKLKVIFEEQLLTPKETARRLGCTKATLAVVRATKRWPLPYIKVGRKVMYDARDVAAFEASRRKER